MTSKKNKPKFNKGDKVCAVCAILIDNNNSSLPWFSKQLRDKDNYIEELLQEIKTMDCKIREFIYNEGD